MRSEQAIFDELAGICASSGYAHAVAYLCSRDNLIKYSGEMKAKDMQHLFSKSRCSRRLNIEPPCRSNIEPGLLANI